MRRPLVIAALLAAGLVAPPLASADDIRVQSTTDTVDAGLVDGMLRAAYAEAQPGDTLSYTAVGTGKALDNARAGLADVVITHAPSLEAKFVADGYSMGLGRQIFYSDYVIVGPTSDPAGVSTKHLHDAVGAFEDIAAAGTANANAVRFNSRGDNSGTNVQEQIIWGLTTSVAKRVAVNAAGDATRFEPAASPSGFPAWYLKTNTGQAANVNQTQACAAAGNGCYTMVDRGTFNRLANAGTIPNLKIVSSNNTADVRGGENLLINPFSAYVVNPAKFPSGPTPNVAAATRFVDFLVSAKFQSAVAGFPTSVDPAFRPDAFPRLTLRSPLPAKAKPGSRLSVAGNAVNRLPGAGAIDGLRLRLQRSSDGGKTWKTVDGATSDKDGDFSLRAGIRRSGRYRIVTSEFPASAYNQFTASKLSLGRVSTRKPKVSKIRLTTRTVALNVSEAARVKIQIQTPLFGGANRYRTLSTITKRTSKATTLHGLHRSIGAGTYRVRVTATDGAGNRRIVGKVFQRR